MVYCNLIQIGFITPRKLSFMGKRTGKEEEEGNGAAYNVEWEDAFFSPLPLFVKWQFHHRKVVLDFYQHKIRITQCFSVQHLHILTCTHTKER